MPFDNPHDEIVFALRMALKSFRIGPPDERRDAIRHSQAEHILAHLERAGYLIVKAERDTGVRPSNIGG